ncbi:MAG: 2-succinyl-5-enolpyruvyl-6-hydroxy-3-cyclohexene-1-carboxylic-acid synthase [Bacteroidia bacterium]|nr:MAG: 2-succinyl-5-enolpyruvyl-6-hydroxy-3-cyclohexene-1-carboxylic-acid synthase [Bacteroidia bacterium]
MAAYLTSNKLIVEQFVEQCVANGLKHVVCSPGSRNSPLVIAFDEHPEVNCYLIHDERSAGFFALGIILEKQEVVAVLCTSGSAVVNYFPAVSEAFYQCLPLLVISADRPATWINQGDGQTIMQNSVFGQHVRYFVQLNDAETNDEGIWYLNRELSVAFNALNSGWKGPVHINIGLEEPLYQTKQAGNIKTSVLHEIKGEFTLSEQWKSTLKNQLQAEKKMLLIGQMPLDESLMSLLNNFVNDTSMAVLLENTSNVQDSKFVHCIDRALTVISEDEIEKFTPDLLIIAGGAVVSKKIKSFFRKHKPKQIWRVGEAFPFMDTYQGLTHTFPVSFKSFLSEMSKIDFERNKSNFSAQWKQKDIQAKDAMIDILLKTPYSDLKVFELVLDYIPDHTQLHMANSSVVRYCQLFDPIKSVVYQSNRGTSGIDGSTSTAIGAAFANSSKLNVIITGDISFFYDSNALWNKYLGNNLRIILINNAGGGIFRFIPGPLTTKQNDDFFEATHQVNAKDICKTFDIEYLSANDISEIDLHMREFYLHHENNRPKLLEIFTPRELNNEVLNTYFNELKSAVIN